jgi:hypothetical protein
MRIQHSGRQTGCSSTLPSLTSCLSCSIADTVSAWQ